MVAVVVMAVASSTVVVVGSLHRLTMVVARVAVGLRPSMVRAAFVVVARGGDDNLISSISQLGLMYPCFAQMV
jgi:hypothetical protein